MLIKIIIEMLNNEILQDLKTFINLHNLSFQRQKSPVFTRTCYFIHILCKCLWVLIKIVRFSFLKAFILHFAVLNVFTENDIIKMHSKNDCQKYN